MYKNKYDNVGKSQLEVTIKFTSLTLRFLYDISFRKLFSFQVLIFKINIKYYLKTHLPEATPK